MIISFSFENNQIAEFPSYFQLIVNGNVIVEDTVASQLYRFDVPVNLDSWNSFVIKIIDSYEIYDPVTKDVVGSNSFTVKDFTLANKSSWPVVMSDNKKLSDVKFNPCYFTWASVSPNNTVFIGQSNVFAGTGYIEFNALVSTSGNIIDHYYGNREKVVHLNPLTISAIRHECFLQRLFNLGTMRLRFNQEYSVTENDSTYCKKWGGMIVELHTDLGRRTTAQWMHGIKWPYKWIHANYYGSNIPPKFSQELLGL